MGRSFFLSLLIACALLSMHACLDPTQITVAITTSYNCDDHPTDTGLFVGGPNVLTTTSDPFNATKERCRSQNDVGSLVVVPSKSASDQAYVRVLAGVDGTTAQSCAAGTGARCIEARRIVRFVSHVRLKLPIVLDEACINVHCREEQTCERGVCVDAHVKPECNQSLCDDGGPPADAGVPLTAKAVYAGFSNACVVASDGSLWCWGANSTQQLPINASSSSTPTKITFPQGAGPIQQVAVGNGHICATDGVKIYCWGANSPGQLGRGSSGNSSPDVQPVVEGKPPGTIASLIAGDGFTCALTTQDLNAGLYCWGTAPTYGTTSPTQVTDAFIAVAAGDQHICGVNENGYVYCAGNNDHGELGYKSPSTGYTDFTTPAVQDRAAQKPVNRVAAGGHHSAAMSASTLYLWGANAFGELSPSPPDPVNPPTMFGVKIDKIVFGNGHRCELSSGVVTCRGDQAKLGGGTANQDTSVKISLDPVADLAASHDATCAVTQAGALFCWGDAPIASGKTPTEIKLGP